MEKCKSIELLKSHNLKATKQRLELLDTILNLENRVFSVKELGLSKESKMDQATVYRILNQLKVSGIIREILTAHDDKRYEISCIHNPVHPHLHCTKCDKIVCLDKLPGSSIEKIEEVYSGIQIDEISINFEGLCKSCMREEN